MMMKVICIVKGITPQKPDPKFCATSRGATPMLNAAIATTATANRANAKASGNQRSDHAQQPDAILDSNEPSFSWPIMPGSYSCTTDTGTAPSDALMMYVGPLRTPGRIKQPKATAPLPWPSAA